VVGIFNGCGQAKKGFNCVWFEFLMDVVRLKMLQLGVVGLINGCGQLGVVGLFNGCGQFFLRWVWSG